MTAVAVDRGVEREYRSIVADNRRWEWFVPRPGDIFVCTPPKCGTTWMQTIVATLLFPNGGLEGTVFEVCPWFDARFTPVSELVARLEQQTHRRAIKTHTPADGIPWYSTASYIVVGRDGRDACMSFLNHMRSMRPDLVQQLVTSAVNDGISFGEGGPMPLDDVHAFFARWLDDHAWFDHVASFWSHRGEPNVLFVHFNDLKADLAGEMRRVAAFLGIAVDEEQWPDLVERCTFASMKARAAEISDFDAGFVGGADAFLYKGTNGRWRDVLTEDELAAFDRRCEELLPPDAMAWTSRGASAIAGG